MRIALVAYDRSPLTQLAELSDPSFGAQAASVSPLAGALARLGHRITIYARKESNTLPSSAILAPGVTVEYVTAGPPVPLTAQQRTAHLAEFSGYLAQRWRRNRPDIAHAHFWTGGLAALAAARDLGVPVAQTFGSLGTAEQRHGVTDSPSAAQIRLEAGIARNANVVLASSAEELEELSRLGVPRARVRVVPYGVDIQRFSPEGPAAERNGRTRLLAAAPLTAARGLDVAMRALAEIPGAELVITGGPDRAELSKHGGYRDLQRIARKLGVHERLVFTGRLAPDDLPALLRSADLLMSTAPYEPAGVVAVQAMACGTPVVAATAGAELDAVIDSTTGLVMPPGQPRQVAARVRWLLGNPMHLEAYGIAAADRARSRYSWDRIGRETVAAYGCGRLGPAASAVAASRDAEQVPDVEPIRAPARQTRRIRAMAPA